MYTIQIIIAIGTIIKSVHVHTVFVNDYCNKCNEYHYYNVIIFVNATEVKTLRIYIMIKVCIIVNDSITI